MRKEVMEKWVSALRSGEYKQGITHLNSDERYCVMGILCEVAIKDGLPLIKRTGCHPFINKYNGQESTLPDIVRQYAGMKTNQGYVVRGNEKIALTHLNDMWESFDQIADIIEKNWEQL